MEIDENEAPQFGANSGALSAEPRGEIEIGELSRLARQLYIEGPFLMRKMMHWRIGICPFERVIRHVPPGASVLDVGCGAGLFLALLAGAEIDGVGFDSSRPAIDTAVRMAERVKLAGLPAKLRFIRLDVSEPWPEGLFDVVSLVDVMHHIPPAHQKSVFEQAVGKVKAGGMLLYKDMANQPAFPAGMNRLHDLVLARQWIHYVPIRRLNEWAEEIGLTEVHAETMSRLFYRHELLVYRKR